MSGATGLQWVAVVPVKALATAKSRLDRCSDSRRRALAGAFAADTVAALGAVERVRAVVVVCTDLSLASTLTGPKVALLDEPSPGGLNEAAAAGVGWASVHHGDAGVAVFPADLPALQPHDVDAALRLAELHGRTVLGDREGVGTTMLAGLPGHPPRPRFGTGSLARHRADGAVVVDPAGLDRAARDVDTDQHLAEVQSLGVGVATRRVLDGA